MIEQNFFLDKEKTKDEVLREIRTRLPENLYTLWRRCEEVIKSEGLPGVISDLRSLLDERVEKVKIALKEVHQSINKEVS